MTKIMIGHQKKFSVIELMVVVAVLLVLFSLTVPFVKSLYISARETVCKNNLKQLGVLCQLYSLDHDGYLPGLEGSDCGQTGYNYWRSNDALYQNWNGHLLPYFNTGISNYHRDVTVHKDGKVYSKGSLPSTEIENNAYQIVNDAFTKGGYGDLTVMICPQAFVTKDLHVLKNYQEFVMPRVMGLGGQHGLNNKSHEHARFKFLPTSYIANQKIFNDIDLVSGSGGYEHYQEATRVGSIKNYDKKVLLLEGGSPLENNHAGFYFDGGKQSHHALTLHGDRNSVFWDNMLRLSFYHHNINSKEVWASGPGDWNGSRVVLPEVFIESFNRRFAPFSYWASSGHPNAAENSGTYYVRLISFDSIDVLTRNDVKDFFASFNMSVPNLPMTSMEGKEYAVGSTHVLRGDGSVPKMHQSELFNRNKELTGLD